MTVNRYIKVYAPLLLCSYAALADEPSGPGQSMDAQQQAAESKAVIEQAAAASASGAGKDAAAKAWIPSAVDFDWIQLTSNEWLKGEIKGMYKDSLEFDSDKLDLLNIDWEDVKILRSHRASSINIEGAGAHYGVLEVTGDSVIIINDYEDKTYDRSRLISFAPGGEREMDLWSIKASLGLNLKQGNTDQTDFTTKVNIKRRASLSRFLLDYIGNITKTGAGDGSLVETVNNHRITGSFDYYKTRFFFYTPVFFEFYRDPFSNISLKSTLGAGAGYTLIDDGVSELSIGGGPAYVKTEFISVAPGEKGSESTTAAVIRTSYDTEITDTVDFIAKYNIQVGNQASGGYTHHIILTLESEITGSLDIDTSFIWDRTSHPATAADGTKPQTDDYQITFGISYTY
jgi:hypothetical protein